MRVYMIAHYNDDIAYRLCRLEPLPMVLKMPKKNTPKNRTHTLRILAQRKNSIQLAIDSALDSAVRFYSWLKTSAATIFSLCHALENYEFKSPFLAENVEQRK